MRFNIIHFIHTFSPTSFGRYSGQSSWAMFLLQEYKRGYLCHHQSITIKMVSIPVETFWREFLDKIHNRILKCLCWSFIYF